MPESLQERFEPFAIQGIRDFLALEKQLETPYFGWRDVFASIFAIEGLASLSDEVADLILASKLKIGALYEEDLNAVEARFQVYKDIRKSGEGYARDIDNPDIVSDLSRIAYRVRREKEEAAILDFVDSVVSRIEMEYLTEMGLAFVKRDDIIRPFAKGPEDTSDTVNWDLYRNFDLKIGGQDFECTATINNTYERQCDFVLKNKNIGKKKSIVINLTPEEKAKRESGIPGYQEMQLSFFRIARRMVTEFKEMSERIADIHSGKRFGSMDVFGTSINLKLGDIDALKKSGEDSRQIAGLQQDMVDIHFSNKELNAIEVAALSVGSSQELEAIQQDEVLFIYHTMRGYITLFKEVLAIGANGETDILDGLDEETLVKVRGYGGGDGMLNTPHTQI